MTNAPVPLAAARLHAACELPGALYTLCHDPAAARVYAAGTDAALYAIDLAADKLQPQKLATPHENYVSSLVLNGGELISASYDRQMVWTDAASGERRRAVAAHDGWVRKIVLFPGGDRLASIGDDLLVKLWDARTGELIRSFAGHAPTTPEGYATTLYALAVSGDGQTLASGDRRGDVILWDVERGRELRRLSAATFYTFDAVQRARAIGGVRGLCFSPQGDRLALSGIGKVTNVDGFVGPCRVEAWDWQAGERVFVGQDAHKAVLNHVAFHPSEPWLAAAGGGDAGGLLAFWNLKSEQPVHKAKPKGHVHQFVLDPHTPQLLAAGFGGLQVWRFDASPPGAEKKG